MSQDLQTQPGRLPMLNPQNDHTFEWAYLKSSLMLSSDPSSHVAKGYHETSIQFWFCEAKSSLDESDCRAVCTPRSCLKTDCDSNSRGC